MTTMRSCDMAKKFLDVVIYKCKEFDKAEIGNPVSNFINTQKKKILVEQGIIF